MAIVSDKQNHPNKAHSGCLSLVKAILTWQQVIYNLGALLSRLGNTDKALDYWNRPVAIKVKMLVGDNHSDLAGSYHNIGILYEEQGDLDKTLEYYNKSLNIGLRQMTLLVAHK